MVLPTYKEWLEKRQPEALPVPPFDRYIYDVVKKGLQPGELGYDGYQPGTGTIAQRDENESHTLELVRQYTNIPVPKLIHQGNGEPLELQYLKVQLGGNISLRQQEGIKLQVQGYTKELAKIPNGSGAVRSLSASGEIIHDQLPLRGPFDSTNDFLWWYEDVDVPLIHHINPLSLPVLPHMDWDLSNVVLHPNMDGVAGIIGWERAAFFPESGGSVHRMCHQWRGWETLFDGIQFY